MKQLGNNATLINKLSGSLTLISSTINDIHIRRTPDGNVRIDVHCKILYSEKQIVKLAFTDIIKYSFLYSSDNGFYYVERFKFFQVGSHIYISFDPVSEEEVVSDEDQDYILCENVEGFLISE